MAISSTRCRERRLEKSKGEEETVLDLRAGNVKKVWLKKKRAGTERVRGETAVDAGEPGRPGPSWEKGTTKLV